MPIIEFTLAEGSPFIEVNQLLKATGVCDSGGAGKMLVAEGLSLIHICASRRSA